MFNYEICNVFDKEIFKKQCSAIEKYIPNLEKHILLEDVDGTEIQKYSFANGKEIKVTNDVDFGINVTSDINLEQFFNH